MATLPRFEQFDRDRNFIVTRAVIVSGKKFGPGDPFDKTLVTTRRLRQLYEHRVLKMGPAELNLEPTGCPNFAVLPEAAIREWLTSHHVMIQPFTNERALAKLAAAEWLKRFGAPEPKSKKASAAKPNGNGNGADPSWEKLPWFAFQKKVFELTGTKPTTKKEALELMHSLT
jgi:hypothetical protein